MDYKEPLYDGRFFPIDGESTFTHKWGIKIPPSAPLGTYNARIQIYDGDNEISYDSFDFEIQ